MSRVPSLPDLYIYYSIAGRSHSSHVDAGLVTIVSVCDLRRMYNQAEVKLKLSQNVKQSQRLPLNPDKGHYNPAVLLLLVDQ